MITRRKRPLHPLRPLQRNKTIPEFKPRQPFPQLDLIGDFQFTQKKQISLKDIDFTIMFNDLYPYYRFSSITTCLIMVVVVEFIWQQVRYNNSSNIQRYLDNIDSGTTSYFWTRLSILITYTNFLLIIASYLESVYKQFFIISYILSYTISLMVFLFKQGSLYCLNSQQHIWTSTYAIYVLILVEKKMKQNIKNKGNNYLDQMWNEMKKLTIWSKLREYVSGQNRENQVSEQNELIDFAFTERPLAIKGGEMDDSFSYDSFFSYSDPMDLLNQDKSGTKSGYFESNISKRSSFISSFPPVGNKQTLTMNNKILNKFITANDINSTPQTTKPFLSASEIQSTIASSQLTKNQKLQEEQQMIKIYKTIIFSYLIYMNTTKVEWIAYLVAVCGVLSWVEILTNEKLRLVKFGCLAVVGIIVVMWF